MHFIIEPQYHARYDELYVQISERLSSEDMKPVDEILCVQDSLNDFLIGKIFDSL